MTIKDNQGTTDIYHDLKIKAKALWQQHDLLNESIKVTARALSTEEAIGNPEDDDYPIQKGKEKLMQAEFKGALGQAFTDHYGNFSGTLNDILEMPMHNNYRRSIFISAMNAVHRHLGLIDHTIHCKDQEPVACADKLLTHIKTHYAPNCTAPLKITQIGLQPRMLEKLSTEFSMRLVDLDPDNIGQTKFAIRIEGPEATDAAIDWCDLLLVTGSTIVNGTAGRFVGKKPVIFYGTTIAGPVQALGLDRFCAESK